MAKQLELSRWDAVRRLRLFLKLRKGKTITELTVNDFEKLMEKMCYNFKGHEDKILSEWREKEYDYQRLAFKAIRCQFIELDKGGIYRLSDISNFSFYKDGKYRATINGELKEISERDYFVLKYITLGEK